MMEKGTLETLEKLGVLGFLGGFLFAQPLVSAGGAVVWGGLTIYNLFLGKNKK